MKVMNEQCVTLPQYELFSVPMSAVMVAQFLSAMADNALLFAAIALLKLSHSPDWLTPVLQEVFAVAFIILAPFVGPFADHIPKGRAMLIANTMKFVGAAAMLAGLNPLLAYNLVGIGAAAYSPAKYGILGEMVGPDKLVKANSLMEGSTIVAILLGAVLGGVLADWSVRGALAAVAVCYLLAAIANLLIPKLPAAHPTEHLDFMTLLKDFWISLRSLMKNKDARFSLIGTSIFWGAGSTLRFLLVAWVPAALLIIDNQTPANLSGVVAIGIAIGAAAAARYVHLHTVNRALPAGILIGSLIMAFAHVTTIPFAILMLLLIGACGGFYVVPLNALLQERGHQTVGSGHAIAVQNFFENFSMMVMVGIYVVMTRVGLSPIAAATGFGLVVTMAIATLSWARLKRTNP